MKKTFCAFAAALLAAMIGVSSAAAADAEKLPDFTDDFESYGTAGAFIEEDASFKENWENNVLKGGEPQLMDSHLAGIAKVEYESGASGNKVLHLDNASVPQNTFFYAGPSNDFRVKNFTAGFRVKFLTENVTERSWVGISLRKKANVHYTGTNNLMFTLQRYRDSSSVTGHAYAVFNGGETSDLSSEPVKALYGEALSVERESYTVPGAAEDRDTPWIDFKVVVSDRSYRVYADGQPVVNCTFNVNSFDYFGYLSFNCCTSNVLIDDFYVNVADTELPPVIAPLPAPELFLDEATRTVTWNAVNGSNLYAVYVNGTLDKTINKRTYTLAEDLAPGTYEIAVVALSADTFEAKDSPMSESVIYTVSAPKKKGCGKSAAALPAAGALLAAGIALVKRR